MLISSKKFIFALIITIISMSANGQINIQSKMDFFINRSTGEVVDQESFAQTFYISFDDSLFKRRMGVTREEFTGQIISHKQIKDEVIGENVIAFTVLNNMTKIQEDYILWRRESGDYSLFQDLPKVRVYFSPDAKCLH